MCSLKSALMCLNRAVVIFVYDFYNIGILYLLNEFYTRARYATMRKWTRKIYPETRGSVRHRYIYNLMNYVIQGFPARILGTINKQSVSVFSQSSR